jgi:uncharacterized membrane protein
MNTPDSFNPKDAIKKMDQHSKSNIELSIRNKSRLETFVDAVIAIVITILVLDLALPRISHTNAAILESLREIWPDFTGYFLAFFLIAIMLNNHHRQYMIIEYANSTLWWINMCFLLFIALIPFTTSVFSEYKDVEFAIILFQLNILIAGLVLYFNFLYVRKHPLLLRKDIDDRTIKILHIANLVVPISALIAICFSFINPVVSNIAFGLIILVLIFSPIIIRHIHIQKHNVTKD